MRKKWIIWLLIALITVFFFWYYFSQVAHTPIGSIIKNPRDYEGKVLHISGKVSKRMSLFVIKYYQLEDETGEIIVISKGPLPAIGEKIRVKGRVKEAFSLLDKQVLVFIEEN